MSDIQESMVQEAISRFGKIELCNGKTIDQSFTRFRNKLLFWFNDVQNSTRVVARVLPK